VIYYFVSCSKSLKLLVKHATQPGSVAGGTGLQPVPYSTCQEAYRNASSRACFRLCYQTCSGTVSFKAIPELAYLRHRVLHRTGSLFPVIRFHALGRLYHPPPGAELMGAALLLRRRVAKNQHG